MQGLFIYTYVLLLWVYIIWVSCFVFDRRQRLKKDHGHCVTAFAGAAETQWGKFGGYNQTWVVRHHSSQNQKSSAMALPEEWGCFCDPREVRVLSVRCYVWSFETFFAQSAMWIRSKGECPYNGWDVQQESDFAKSALSLSCTNDQFGGNLSAALCKEFG